MPPHGHSKNSGSPAESQPRIVWRPHATSHSDSWHSPVSPCRRLRVVAPRAVEHDDRETDDLDREPDHNQDIDQQYEGQVEIELGLKVLETPPFLLSSQNSGDPLREDEKARQLNSTEPTVEDLETSPWLEMFELSRSNTQSPQDSRSDPTGSLARSKPMSIFRGIVPRITMFER